MPSNFFTNLSRDIGNSRYQLQISSKIILPVEAQSYLSKTVYVPSGNFFYLYCNNKKMSHDFSDFELIRNIS